MRNFIDTITSKAYWQFVLFSRAGAVSVFAFFGAFYLIVETLDFFRVYTRDDYGSWAFLGFLVLSVVASILARPPIKSLSVRLPDGDGSIEIRVADIFEVSGAVMISTNNRFEFDVAGGKIAIDSLQGQFTAKYFAGSQNELIEEIKKGIDNVEGSVPYPVGTTVPINTHGKTFYFTAMADMNDQGNAWTTVGNIEKALAGLWIYVRKAGELQELVVPVIGTGRGRLRLSRKKMIAVIAESYAKASDEGKITDKLVIVVRPDDASKFCINLYDIKDHLNHILYS